MNNSNIENSIDIVVSILKGCNDNTVKKSTNKLAKAINEASCPEQALVMWAEVGLFPESNAYAELVEDIYPMVKETISQALLGAHKEPDTFWNVRHQSALEKKKKEESENKPIASRLRFERFFLNPPEQHIGSIVAHGIGELFGSLCSEEKKAELRKPKEDAKLVLAAKSRMSPEDLRLRLRGKI